MHGGLTSPNGSNEMMFLDMSIGKERFDICRSDRYFGR